MHQNGELEKVLDAAGVLVPYEEAEERVEKGQDAVIGQETTDEIRAVHNDQPGGKQHDIKKVI
jgi:hypothetical protein